MRERIVVTGMGAVTPVGIGIDNYWENLVSGKSGISRIEAFNPDEMPVQIAAEIKNFKAEEYMDKKLVRNTDRFSQFAYIAANEALKNGLPVSAERMGIVLGTAMSGISPTAETQEKLTLSEKKMVEPRFVPRILGNMAATQISISHGIKGPSVTVSTACASGGDAVSAAARLLLAEEADAVIAVGAESTICPLVMLSLASARALSRENKTPNSFNLNYMGGYSTIYREGFGIIRWANNCEFKGLFHNGISTGWGIFSHPQNGTFRGEYENDCPNGYGIYKHITDSTYEGNWVNEKQEGYGIEKWQDGAAYRGQFIYGKKNGIGLYIFPNKNIYLGEWTQNLMNGYGIYSFGTNQLYMGEWVNGYRDGYGELYGPNHKYFYGYFRNNLKNGFFMFYNSKSRKIIIGYNTNGKLDGVIKCFRGRTEVKLIIARNGKKIKEIENEEKINKYLNEPKHFEPDHPFIKDKTFNKYFFMKRNDLEKILMGKCSSGDYEQINERLRKGH